MENPKRARLSPQPAHPSHRGDAGESSRPAVTRLTCFALGTLLRIERPARHVPIWKES